VDEVEHFLTWHGVVHRVPDDVDLARLHGGQQAVEAQLQELDFNAELLLHQPGKIGVDSLGLARNGIELDRRYVHERTGDDLAFLTHIVGNHIRQWRISGGIRHGGTGHGKSQQQAAGHGGHDLAHTTLSTHDESPHRCLYLIRVSVIDTINTLTTFRPSAQEAVLLHAVLHDSVSPTI